MDYSIPPKVQDQEKMEEAMISNTTQSLSPTPKPWKLYQNPIFTDGVETTTNSTYTDLEHANAEIIDLKAQLQFERGLRERMECHTKTLCNELEKEKRLREAAERVNDELGVRALGHEAEIGSIRRVVDEEKKMMRVAEVFREGKVQEKPMNENVRRRRKQDDDGYGGHAGVFVSPISVLRRSDSPEPENPHIKRGIKGSVEFQRVVKAMCTNKANSKHLGGSYKLECQKAQLKILLKQRSPVRQNSYFIS